MIRILIVLLIFICTSNIKLSACELTEEYKALRKDIYREAYQAYEGCIKSVSNFYYWKEVSNCMADGLDDSVKGGCAHIAGYKMGKNLENKGKHCEVLKPSVDDIKLMFKEMVRKSMGSESIDSFSERRKVK